MQLSNLLNESLLAKTDSFYAVCLFKEVEEISSGLSALDYVLLHLDLCSVRALLRETQASFNCQLEINETNEQRQPTLPNQLK